jgi:hypothetical protein
VSWGELGLSNISGALLIVRIDAKAYVQKKLAL